MRPSVSVVVPFHGTPGQAEALLAALAGLRLGEADEIVVADNTAEQVTAGLELPERCRVVAARGEGSPARARNAGAMAVRGAWLLFLDSDCKPDPGLIESYFQRPIAADCGIVAGRLEVDPRQSSLAATYARTRRVLDQADALANPFRPYAYTANMLVRAQAWRQLGGFLEGIYNGEDVDFCWRARDAGWTLTYRPDAVAVHAHRESVRDLVRQASAHAASESWVHRRWELPPARRAHPVRNLVRAAIGVPAFLVTGQVQRARLKLVDAAVQVTRWRARHRSNRARPWPSGPTALRPVQLWCDDFPVLSETFVVNEARALGELGHGVQVVARRRPGRPAIGIHDVTATFMEDDTRRERQSALVRLVLRHPLRCALDLASRRRWRADEAVMPLRRLAPAVLRALETPDVTLHAHFAAQAALNAMRTARIAGVPWTLTAHAYDIYLHPANLELKLRRAAFVTSGCDYTVRALRRLAGPAAADRMVKMVMGVDPDRFQRRAPHPSAATVVAVGRLVEKKGFEHLVRATAHAALKDVVERVVIAGEGPERGNLEALAGTLGVGDVVELAGPLEPDAVRTLLDGAAVLAMPCVVARDGDRDSMPVVVKEALAMEVPVVCSAEVGLPELVRPEWGRLVPPGDPGALAAALAELLALTPAERASMGRAGREFVRAHADVRRETERLSERLERLPRG